MDWEFELFGTLRQKAGARRRGLRSTQATFVNTRRCSGCYRSFPALCGGRIVAGTAPALDWWPSAEPRLSSSPRLHQNQKEDEDIEAEHGLRLRHHPNSLPDIQGSARVSLTNSPLIEKLSDLDAPHVMQAFNATDSRTPCRLLTPPSRRSASAAISSIAASEKCRETLPSPKRRS